jgi:hypothetical protein
VASTAMYWHVRNKDDLVVLAGDHVCREIELPDPAELGGALPRQVWLGVRTR